MMPRSQRVRPLGILMLDTRFPRIEGDIGNPASFDFPVILRTMRGIGPDDAVYIVDEGSQADAAEGVGKGVDPRQLSQRRLVRREGVQRRFQLARRESPEIRGRDVGAQRRQLPAQFGEPVLRPGEVRGESRWAAVHGDPAPALGNRVGPGQQLEPG